jgi:hypothetical protein
MLISLVKFFEMAVWCRTREIMETQNETVKSITAWDWIINAVSIEN